MLATVSSVVVNVAINTTHHTPLTHTHNSRTAMMAAISPAAVNVPETLSTLRYAASAKKVATKPVVNEDESQKVCVCVCVCMRVCVRLSV